MLWFSTLQRLSGFSYFNVKRLFSKKKSSFNSAFLVIRERVFNAQFSFHKLAKFNI